MDPIKNYEELYDFINSCITNNPYDLLRVCNYLRFNVINFKKNFESLKIFTIDVCEIVYKYDKYHKTNNTGIFEIHGYTTFDENTKNIESVYKGCIINKDGLIIFCPEENTFEKIYLFYEDTNKAETFEYIDNLYKNYNIELIEILKNLEKGYIELKHIQCN